MFQFFYWMKPIPSMLMLMITNENNTKCSFIHVYIWLKKGHLLKLQNSIDFVRCWRRVQFDFYIVFNQDHMRKCHFSRPSMHKCVRLFQDQQKICLIEEEENVLLRDFKIHMLIWKKIRCFQSWYILSV